jgi:GMP synthase (glutamine-hydrolysing)
MHESFEAPGAIEIWANRNNFPVSYTRLFNGDKLPETSDGFDYLIVMGGPQSPATTTVECPHFDTQAEVALIRKAIQQNKYVLGICLGAQLIGEAFGAKFDHSPNREIGVYDLTLTAQASNDPVFSKFPSTFPVGHWHGDMPGLTKDAQILATSEGCPRQIVKYSPKIYGFQCHFEFTKESIEGMIQNCSDELEKYKELPYIENAEKLRSHDFSEINGKLFIFLDYIKGLFESDK